MKILSYLFFGILFSSFINNFCSDDNNQTGKFNAIYQQKSYENLSPDKISGKKKLTILIEDQNKIKNNSSINKDLNNDLNNDLNKQLINNCSFNNNNNNNNNIKNRKKLFKALFLGLGVASTGTALGLSIYNFINYQE